MLLVPNLDHQNEQFQLFSNCTIQSLHLSVYDRWGSKVFHQQGTPTPWDGKISGKSALPGVYLIKVQYELTDDTGEVQMGHLVQQLVILE
ncbi:MAG: T9SS type B sorting domain-containing protein [Saprospiraceae bacterium]|nr:T9SS type B sorting domain-containing protein [Saprospiraceae bacterium]